MKRCTYCERPARNGRMDCYRCNNLKRCYGINSVEYDWMMFMQGYECAIEGCSAHPVVVDHCHTTGATRQLLCKGCNTKLGALESKLLPGLIKYIHTHALQQEKEN